MLNELADLYIVTMNALALSGYTPELIAQAVSDKLSYNKIRPDHVTVK